MYSQTPRNYYADSKFPPANEKELPSFLGVINYLGKLLPSPVDACESVRNITSSKYK